MQPASDCSATSTRLRSTSCSVRSNARVEDGDERLLEVVVLARTRANFSASAWTASPWIS